VKRVATFIFSSPPPAVVDEQLALYDDGTARLVVHRPRGGQPTIGTYSYKPDHADFAELSKQGTDPVTLDLLGPVPEEQRDLLALASRIAEEAREHAEATASFYGRPFGSRTDGLLSISMAVVAAGKRAVEFELAPKSSAVLFSNQGQPAGWFDFPKLQLGFVTPDAEDLGGLLRSAKIKPGDWGALLVKLQAPDSATEVSIQVAGRLYQGLPDEDTPGRFEVRTEAMPIEAAG
jgi:hypothetical protein